MEELKQRWVHFRIRDVFVPDPQKLLTELYGEDLLQGKVVDFSTNWETGGSYAVVEVEGVDQMVIVPVQCIRGVA